MKYILLEEDNNWERSNFYKKDESKSPEDTEERNYNKGTSHT